MNNWKGLIDLKGKIKFEEMKATNFRIPKGLRRLIDEDHFMMKYEEDDYVSFNEFLLLLIVSNGHYVFDEQENDWKREKGGTSLYEFYQHKKKKEEN